MEVLKEQVQTLNRVIYELRDDFRRLVEEFKVYRHEVRDVLHQNGLQIDRLEHDFKALEEDMKRIQGIIAAITAQENQIKGGVVVGRWVWSIVGACGMAVIEVALHKWGV